MMSIKWPDFWLPPVNLYNVPRIEMSEEAGRYESKMKQDSELEATLKERGNRYGDFCDHAVLTQNIKIVMQSGRRWNDLAPYQTEALEMIAHKIGRILNGDPDYFDSWRDIAGYATLVDKELTGE
jgi:hypothetical protein